MICSLPGSIPYNKYNLFLRISYKSPSRSYPGTSVGRNELVYNNSESHSQFFDISKSIRSMNPLNTASSNYNPLTHTDIPCLPNTTQINNDICNINYN